MTTAQQIIDELAAHAGEADADKTARIFADTNDGTVGLNLHMRTVFAVAKAHVDLPIAELRPLLASNYYEVRMAAVAIMDAKARLKRTGSDERQALFALYLDQHDRINSWGLVDRAAPAVIGTPLLTAGIAVLKTLAQSPDFYRRRTAIDATYAFLKQDRLDETYEIAELLLTEPHPLNQNQIGGYLREAGKHDQARLIGWLERFAPQMSAKMLTAALAQCDPETKRRIRALQA